VIIFTPRQLYHRGKNSQYPLDRRLDGPEPVWTLWSRDKALAYGTKPRLVMKWTASVSEIKSEFRNSSIYRNTYTIPTERPLRPLISVFLTGAAISFKYLFNYPHEAEWTPFQTHYISENLVASRIEPGPLDL
jgi:hypothetical protein